jgi:hypothetical protein
MKVQYEGALVLRTIGPHIGPHLRRVHPPTAHTPIPPNQKIDFSHTVYNTNN